VEQMEAYLNGFSLHRTLNDIGRVITFSASTSSNQWHNGLQRSTSFTA
jgi:hypothetical protein